MKSVTWEASVLSSVILACLLCFIVGSEAQSIFVGKAAPDFQNVPVVMNGKLDKVSLSQFKGRYLVIIFYPLDFTFVCPTELIAYSERIQEFEALNVNVLAVSVDSVYSHLAWITTPRVKGGIEGLKIPLISDITKSMSRNYGVLIEEEGIALRGLFIIDHNGIVRQITVNDLPVGRSVDETLRLLQAFQYTDQHGGEVCPANWKKGKMTLKANPRESLDYFRTIDVDASQSSVKIENQ